MDREYVIAIMAAILRANQQHKSIRICVGEAAEILDQVELLPDPDDEDEDDLDDDEEDEDDDD